MDTNPTNPQTDDNAQNQYQQILDKYAQELSGLDTNPESVANPSIPQMPVQSTEVPPSVPELAQSLPEEPKLSETSTLPPHLDLPQMPQPSENIFQDSLTQSPDKQIDLNSHPLPPEVPIIDTPQNDYVPPQPPPITPVITSTSDNYTAPQPSSFFPGEAMTTDSYSEPPKTENISPPIPEVTPVSEVRPLGQESLPLSNETPMPEPVLNPVSDTIKIDTPDIPVVPLTTSANNSKKNPIAKYFFFVSLFIFMVIFAAVIYTFVQSQKQSAAPLNLNVTPTQSVPANTDENNSAGTCTVNDVTYQSGESFTAADQCNTCTCLEDGTITCTEKDCTPQTIKPTDKP